MSTKDTLKFIFNLFCIITTVQIIYAVIVYGLIMDNNIAYPMIFLRQTLILSLAGSLPILALARRETALKKEIRIRKIIHLIVTTALVLSALYHFDWLDIINLIFTLVSFVVFYIVVYVYWDAQAKNLADKLNKRIIEFRTYNDLTDYGND